MNVSARQVATVQLQVTGTATIQQIVVPANVPHAIAFCDPIGSWNSHRWYLIRKDAVDQDWTGPITPDPTDPKCFQTAKLYTFEPGGHNLEVILWNHCDVNDPDPLCHVSVPGGVPCDITLGCDAPGAPATFTVLAGGTPLAGPPSAIRKGQVVR